MSQRPPREIILATAGELFHQKSYSSVTIDQIIEAAQMNPAEFYRNFPTKSALGLMWLQRLYKGMEMTHESFLKRPVERERRLKKYFLSMLSWMESKNFRSCQFANTAACIDPAEEPEMAEVIDRYKRHQRDFFIQVAETIVGSSDAQKIGTTIFILYSGAMTEAQNLKATWPLEDALVAAEKVCGLV